MIRIFAIATAASLLTASSASAVGFLTQMSCASDYYAYCSQFKVGSKELRVCMRRAGPKLSKSCLNALIADGEVSKAEVERTKQEILAARNGAKQPPAAKQKSEEPKQKRTAIAKADDSPRKSEARPHGDKKREQENEPAQKAEKLTFNEQTFAALKERQPKFIEEAAAAEAPPPVPDPDKRARSADVKSSSAKNSEPEEEIHTPRHKKKAAKKSKGEKANGHKKAKTKVAAKRGKVRSASRNRRYAGE